MTRDILLMRDVAREIDARNRVIKPDEAWWYDKTTREYTAIERAALTPDPTDSALSYCVRQCGTRLTLGDGSAVCRRCRATIGGQDFD